MTVDEYIREVKPLSIHARFAIGLRVLERYVRVRGIEDNSVWTYLTEMWEFPQLATLEAKLEWEKSRCDLADYGLGDELPEELEEELYSLAINEDYFELWVTHVTELAWTNMLKGPQDDESIELLTKVLNLAAKSEIGLPSLTCYSSHLYAENAGWGVIPTDEELEVWQSVSCSIEVKCSDEPDCPEAIAFFD